jgi:hypothetical protein
MKRSRIKPVSDKRRDRWPAEKEVRLAVFARDGWRCQAPGAFGLKCWGGLTYHHLEKAWKGSNFTVDNGLTLCEGHNVAVENHPIDAEELGLVRKT